jgi:antitoxin (DNA-binding transcriptional repressor) of toxin-antitoxin stability system
MSDRDPGQAASPFDLSLRHRPPRVADDDALVFTMRELNQQTARVMNEIEKTGRPAFITRHGRFVALVAPLSPGQVESRVLAATAREIVSREEA